MKRLNMQPEKMATRKRKFKEYVVRQGQKMQKVHRLPPLWRWEYQECSGTCRAWTRSEAKSMVKYRFDIKGRLPKEAIVEIAPTE